MEKKMEPFEVKTEKGAICISQRYFGEPDSSVWIHVDQVDLFISLLQEARTELKAAAEKTGSSVVA